MNKYFILFLKTLKKSFIFHFIDPFKEKWKYWIYKVFIFTYQMVGTLSDGLGTLNMDRHYQDRREQLKTSAQSSKGHLLAGVKGFGNGLFGAMTSIFTQPYDGFKEDGIEVHVQFVHNIEKSNFIKKYSF